MIHYQIANILMLGRIKKKVRRLFCQVKSSCGTNSQQNTGTVSSPWSNRSRGMSASCCIPEVHSAWDLRHLRKTWTMFTGAEFSKTASSLRHQFWRVNWCELHFPSLSISSNYWTYWTCGPAGHRPPRAPTWPMHHWHAKPLGFPGEIRLGTPGYPFQGLKSMIGQPLLVSSQQGAAGRTGGLSIRFLDEIDLGMVRS